MTKPKVLVKDSELPLEGIKVLENKCEIIMVPMGSTLQDIINIVEKANGVDGIVWSSHMIPSNEFFDACGKSLKVFGSVAAGYDHLPIKEMKSRGILVSNTPGVLARAVAEIAVLLTIAASRRFEEGRRAIVE